MKPFRRWTRKILHAYVPSLFDRIRRVRRLFHDRRVLKRRNLREEIKRLFIERHGRTIQAGPFKGMAHIGKSTGSPVLEKLIGSYERELWEVVEMAIGLHPPVVIDIGCDEGYYAVGFALRLREATVYAFDTNENAQSLCKEMARINGVERNVVVGGYCSCAELNRVLAANALIFVDCEGSEFEILDTDSVPLLTRTTVICELHDHKRLDVEITPTICSRFRSTHDIAVLDISRRDLREFPSLHFMPAAMQRLAVMEDRTNSQQWLFMIPKKRV